MVEEKVNTTMNFSDDLVLPAMIYMLQTMKEKCQKVFVSLFFLCFYVSSCLFRVRSGLLNFAFCVFQIQLCFPEEGAVYDYNLDDAGISCFDDEDGEGKERKVRECF